MAGNQLQQENIPVEALGVARGGRMAEVVDGQVVDVGAFAGPLPGRIQGVGRHLEDAPTAFPVRHRVENADGGQGEGNLPAPALGIAQRQDAPRPVDVIPGRGEQHFPLAHGGFDGEPDVGRHIGVFALGQGDAQVLLFLGRQHPIARIVGRIALHLIARVRQRRPLPDFVGVGEEGAEDGKLVVNRRRRVPVRGHRLFQVMNVVGGNLADRHGGQALTHGNGLAALVEAGLAVFPEGPRQGALGQGLLGQQERRQLGFRRAVGRLGNVQDGQPGLTEVAIDARQDMLGALLGHHEIVGVIAQGDRQGGGGGAHPLGRLGVEKGQFGGASPIRGLAAPLEAALEAGLAIHAHAGRPTGAFFVDAGHGLVLPVRNGGGKDVAGEQLGLTGMFHDLTPEMLNRSQVKDADFIRRPQSSAVRPGLSRPECQKRVRKPGFCGVLPTKEKRPGCPSLSFF